MLKKLLSLFILILLGSVAIGQTYNLTSNLGTITTCSGTFSDGAGGYGNNASYTVTFCSGTGANLMLSFTSFSLETGYDRLIVYDGPTTASTVIDNATGNLTPFVVQSSGTCLTVKFTSDGSNIGAWSGWVASISCHFPCITPTAGGAITNQTAPVKVCTGEAINFSGASSTAGAGYTLSTYLWHFDDGTTGTGVNVSHSYSTPGEYTVNLDVTDNNGCTNTNHIDLVIKVGTVPSFAGTTGNQTVCAGQNVCLNGVVTPTTWTDTPTTTVAGTTPLPDGSGVCYNAPLTFTEFAAGQTITSASQIQNIFANMEHSWAGDLTISIICPNGQQAGLFNSDGTWNTTNITSEAFGNQSVSPPTGYNYTWTSTGTTMDAWDAANPTATVIPAGTYGSEVPYTNLVGCPLNGVWQLKICDLHSIDDGTVFNWGLTFDPSVYSSLPSFTPVFNANCAGTYWSGNNAASTSAITSTSANCDQICVTPPTAGTYSYTYTGIDDFGCTYTTVTTVTATPGPVISGFPANITQCPGTSVAATAMTGPAGAPATTFAWTNSNTAIGLGASGAGQVPTFTTTNATGAAISGTITVTATRGGCTTVQTYTITVSPKPTVAVSNVSVCAGASVPATAFTSTPAGATYAWTNSNTAIGLAASGAGNVPTFTATNAGATAISGTITVTPTLAGCPGTPSTYTITVNPIPASTFSQPANQCLTGNSFTFTNTGGVGTYAWTFANGTPATSTSLNQTVTFSPAGGPYTITHTVTSAAGCSSTTNSTVTIYPMPVVTVTPSFAICAGASGSLTAAGASTYSWAPATGLSATTGTTVTATPASTTTYTVTGTSVNGCVATATVTVTITPLPVVNVPPATICAGTPATLTASGATTYSWSPATGLSATTGTSVTATPAATTTYTVSGTTSGCTGTTTVTVTVNPIPVTAVPSPTICPGGTASLTASGATTYAWTAGLSATTGATVTGSPAATTSYTVTGTSLGCSSTAVATITVGSSIVPTVNSPSICVGQTATLNAANATTFSWTAGLSATTGASVTGSPAATTSYTVTGTTGTCTGTAVATITVNPLPVITVPAITICAGTAGTLNASGASTYSWAPSTGLSATTGTSVTANPAATTTYTVTGTSATGCVNTKTVVVTVNPLPTVSAAPITICAGLSGTLTASGAATYSWAAATGLSATTGTSVTANPVATTTYTVTGTSAAGCVNTSTVIVTVNPLPTITVAPITICAGISGTLTASGANTYSWSPATGLSATTGASVTANPAATTTYTVTGTAATGCINTATVVVTVSPSATLTMAKVNVSCFNGTNGSATVTATGGTTPYTYAWAPSGGSAAAATGLAAGTYTVTVTTNNGCISTSTAVITQPTGMTLTMASVNASCGTANGQASVSVTGGTSPYTYSWAPSGGTAATATGLVAGSYTVTVTDNNTCTSTNSVAVNNSTSPTASTTVISNVSCFGGNNGSASVTISGGTSPYTQSWSPSGGTATTANSLTAGTYTVTVTDNSGCIVTANATITQPPVLTASTVKTDVTCFGTSTGTATVTAGGGTSPYSYSWAPSGGTGTTASSLAAGTYTVTVTDAKGCTKTATAIIAQPPAITSTMSNTPVSCFGGNNGSASVVAGGGTPGYSYLWAAGGSTSATASALTSGTYTVTITDLNGCTKTASTTVTQPTALTATTTVVNSTCGASNGSATVTAGGGTTTYSYSWAPSGGSAATAAALTAGTYTVTVTDLNGCTKTATATVNDLSGLVASISSQTNVSCFGGNNGSVTVTASGSTAPYTYSSNGGTTYQASGTFASLTAGNYTITCKDANGCTVPVSVTITQPAALAGAITAQTNILCNGTSTGSVTVAGSAGTSPYTYAINGVTFGPSGTFSSLAAGPYTVTVKDSKGCTMTVPVVITQPTALTASITSQTNNICFGGNAGSVTVTATGGTSAYSYSLNGAPVQPTGTFNSMAVGSYTVTVTDANACTTTVPVVITQPTQVTVSAVKTNATCGASNGTLTATGANGTSPYTYSINGVTYQASGSFTGLAAASYTVTVKDANSCSNTTTISIVDLSGLVASISSQTDVSCFGGNNGSVTVAASGSTGPYTYSSDATTYQPSGTFSSLTAGSYTITAKDANGCTTTVPVTITQPPVLSASISAQTNVSCFGANNGSVTIAATGGTTPYLYAIDGGAPVSTATFTGLTAATHSVIVKDGKGCTTTVPVIITQPPALTLTTSSVNSVCTAANGSATVNASGGTPTYSYLWSNSQTGVTANNIPAGNYSVLVTDNNGCTQTALVTVNANPGGTATISSTTNVTCTGANNGSATVSMGGASTPPFIYAWNPSSQSTTTATNLSPASYTVTVTDGNGCIASATAVISEPSPITTSFSNVNTTCNGGNNGQSTLTASGGTTPYSYLWLPGGQTTQTATNLTAGTYTVTITDNNGCTKTSTTVITEPSAMTLNATHIDANCNQSNGSATVFANGGTGPYAYVWNTTPFQNTQTLVNVPANTYLASVTDNNGCIETLTVTIDNLAGPVATLVSSTDVSCYGQNNGNATTTVNGGTSPYTFAWNNGQTLPTATNLVAGTYTMTATDQHGCTASVSATIVEPAPLVTTSSSVNPSCFGGNNGSISTNTNGGTTPYTYLWSPGAASTNNLSNLTAGTYTLQVTDSKNCTTLTPVTLTQPAALTATTSSQNVTCSGLCNGTTTANPGAGNGPFTYLWSDLNAQTTQIATGLCGGTYTVTVKDANGCSAIATANVSVPNAMIAAIPTFTDVTCFGACDGSAQSTVSGGTAPYIYNWNIGPLGTQGASVNNLCAGSYTMTVTDVNGCQASASQTIQQPPPLTASINHTDVTCYGMCDAQATAVYTGGTGPYTFSWTPSMQTTPTVLNLCAGVQTMVITDSHNCSANSTVVIQEPTVLAVSTTATTSNCGNADGSACAQITGGTPPFTYSWNDPASQTTSCAVNLNANAYTISITDAHGCSVTNVANVNDITGPVVTIPTSTNVTCAGTSDGTAQGNISGGALPYASVLWTPSGQTSSFATGLAGGQYSLVVTDASGCRGSNTVSITEPFPLAAGIVHTNTSCNLVCDGSATVNVGGGTAPYTYVWNDPAAQTTAIASSLCAQTYTVTVTDAHGCAKTTSTTVDQPTPLSITQTAFSNVSCNGGSNGSVTTSVAGGTPGYTYLWSPGNQANSQATNLTAGSYTLLVTDAHQCSQTFVQNITEPSALVLTPNSNPSKCGNSDGSAGVSVTAGTGTAPYTYFWSPTGLSSAIISNVPAGSYTVTVTDGNACTATATSIVANLSGPVINSVTPSTPLCYNTPTGSATVSVSGGQLPYNYSWSNATGTIGQNSATATALVNGVYSVTVTDLNGCAQTGSVVVQPATPVVILPIPTDTICIGQSSQIFGAASGGTPNYTYTWNPPFTGQPGPIYNVSPTTTTVYSVSAIDEHGCLSNMQTATVFVHQQIKVIATDTSICSGQSVPISAVATQGTGGPYTYSWSNGSTLQTQTVTPAGTGGTVNYIVTANDIGCSIAVTDTATVTINTLPFGSMNTLDTAGCEAFNAVFIGNSNGVSYLWNFGDGSTSTLQNPSHVYSTTNGALTSYNVSLTVTSALGCTSTITNNAFIDVYPTPVAGFTSSPSQPTTTSPVVSFTDQSTGATHWNWDFIYTTPPLGLYTDTLQNPMYSYPDSGTYVVQEVVSNNYGCYDTAYNTVEIVPEYILYAPNAFTPFNHDGINDVFMPKGLGIDPDHFEMMIFDRWGNMIFKTNDISKGWDGKANGGSKVAQVDVYVWKITTKDFRGNNHNYIGHVSIVK